MQQSFHSQSSTIGWRLHSKKILIVCGLLFSTLFSQLQASSLKKDSSYQPQKSSCYVNHLEKGFLSDPFLQNPTPTTVTVVWFTEFEGKKHFVTYGDFLQKRVRATTRKLSRIRENTLNGCKPVSVWRHEAVLDQLIPKKRVQYRVSSIKKSENRISSNIYSCASTPSPDACGT